MGARSEGDSAGEIPRQRLVGAHDSVKGRDDF